MMGDFNIHRYHTTYCAHADSKSLTPKLPISPKKRVGEFEIRGGGEGV